MDEPHESIRTPARLPYRFFLGYMSKIEAQLAWCNHSSFLSSPVQVGCMLTPNPCHPDPSLFASIWVAPTALILHTMDSCEEVILLWTRLPYLPFLPLHRFPGKRLPLLYLVYTLCPKNIFTSFEFRISVWPPWTGYQRPPLTATHAAEVVTPPTLWCCTIQKEPCLLLEFLNLDPTEINTAVLSQFILPPHSCVTKIGLPDTKKTGIL